jgi:uncharacterized protein
MRVLLAMIVLSSLLSSVLLLSAGSVQAQQTRDPEKMAPRPVKRNSAMRPAPSMQLALEPAKRHLARTALAVPAYQPTHALRPKLHRPIGTGLKQPVMADRVVFDHASLVTAVNAGAVGVMSEGASDHYMRMVADLSSVFDDAPKLRIVGIIGKGTVQNLRDLRFLRGVDVALMHSDALDVAKKLREGGDVASKISYIARLQDEEMHILAKNEITDIHQLAGKKVNVSLAGSGVAASSGNVFDRLGIHVELVNFPERLAQEKLRAGEIDAAVFWDPIPDQTIVTFKNDGRFHLVPVPYEESLQSVYYPASIPADTYPGLVPAGQKLETVSLNAVVVAYNWPAGSDRAVRVANFAELFLSKFADLQKPGRDPIWQAIDPVGIAQGWQRLPAAQHWIDANIAHAVVPGRSPNMVDPTMAEFQTFLNEAPNRAGAKNSADAQRLFEEFISWRKSKAKSP